MKIRKIQLPTENWVSTGLPSLYHNEAYMEGWLAAMRGFTDGSNPYELSGHERDTSFMNELHYQWMRGYDDFKDNIL